MFYKKNSGQHPEVLNLETFKDPIATQIEWTPLKRNGSNFRSHNFIKLDNGYYGFRPTTTFIISSFVFILCSLCPIAILYLKKSIGNPLYWPIIFLSLIFSILATLILILGFRKNEFQLTKKTYIQGGNLKTSFDQVYAIQFLSIKFASYTSYELNLILKNLERVNIIGHGDCEELRRNGKTIAHFLNVPFWDIVEKK